MIKDNQLIHQLDKLPDSKKLSENYNCSYCGLESGYCIKCDYGNCLEKFHVRCAIDNDLIKTRSEMEDHYSKTMMGMVYIFCESHEECGKQIVI